MPFKSKSQQRYMYAMKDKDKLKGVDLDEWSKKTNFKKLPERKKSFKKEARYNAAVDGFIKLASVANKLIKLPTRTPIQVHKRTVEVMNKNKPSPVVERYDNVAKKR